LIGVSHLDLINWTNRLKWWFWELTGSKRKYVFFFILSGPSLLTTCSFNAIAFYLDICGKCSGMDSLLSTLTTLDMLSKEGL
jgi:hypothetical protein